jgi:RNA polymerase sigma-70 factor (ECF subfamily)
MADPPDDASGAADAAFERERPRLRALAYRMLGSSAEADDILQEAWLRWREVDDADSPRAYLTAVVTRLCLDQLKSARARRETYVGPWLPEPVRTVADEPDRESISVAVLVLLERLSPVERAALLLHQVFDYSHAEIAALLGRDEANVRQSLHRARARVVAERPRFAACREDHARLLAGFVAACSDGDLPALESLLAADAVARTDAGGKVRAARKEVKGRDRVARFFVGLMKKGETGDAQAMEPAEINGWPALVLRRGDGSVASVVTIETDGAHIWAVDIVSNPDKLSRI